MTSNCFKIQIFFLKAYPVDKAPVRMRVIILHGRFVDFIPFQSHLSEFNSLIILSGSPCLPETSPLHFLFFADVNSLNDSFNAFRILMKSEGSLSSATLSNCPTAPVLVLSNKSCAALGKVNLDAKLCPGQC